MAKTLLINPPYEISSSYPVEFDISTKAEDLAKNPLLTLIFSVPFRAPCPCCGAKMKKVSKKLWKCSKQENVFCKMK